MVCGTGAHKLLGCKTGHIFTEDNSENRFTSRYMDIPNTPLYPFGYGLSYTEFDISDIDVQTGQDKKVHIHCNVCNTGNVAGTEVVQCYYETLYASVVRPKKELVRFRKVFLEPGEKKDVDFLIDQEEFSYYGKNMETVSSGMKLLSVLETVVTTLFLRTLYEHRREKRVKALVYLVCRIRT